MSHVFDFSTSTRAIDQFQEHSLNYLFGVYSGTVVPEEFWTGDGSLYGRFSYHYEYYDAYGYLRVGTAWVNSHLDGYGTYYERYDGDVFDPLYYAGDPALIGSADFLGNADQMTLFSGYSFLRFEDLPTIARSFGTIPQGTFADYNALAEYIAQAVAYANATYLDQLRALESMNLADAGPIVTENLDYGDGYPPGAFRLVYTADPDTDLTIGDIMQVDPDGFGYPSVSVVSPTYEMFAGQDVSIILTGLNDNLSDFPLGFSARSLEILAGDGDDSITIGGDSNSDPSRGSLPEDLVIDGGAGDDWISAVIRNSADIRGGEGNDSIYLSAIASDTPARVRILGEAGADSIMGAFDSANWIDGGEGDDYVVGGYNGQDTLYGGAGNDWMEAGNYWDSFNRWTVYSEVGIFLDGGAGDDFIGGGNGDDTIYGGDGNDEIFGMLGDDTLYGGAGQDTYALYVNESDLSRSFGDKVIHDDGGIIAGWGWMSSDFDVSRMARSGNDLIVGQLGTSSIRIVDYYLNLPRWSATADPGADLVDFERAATLFDPAMSGTAGADNVTMTMPGHFRAFEGNDTVRGTAGADTISGGNGNDLLEGRQGDDLLEGGNGNDTLFGGLGNDRLLGGPGNDWLNGGPGNDTLNGGMGTDWVSFMGEARAARVDLAVTGPQATGHGLDVIVNIENIHGGAGNDTLLGNAQANVIRGGNGADRILGRQGNDVLEGGTGHDTLEGGLGNDRLLGGMGNDWLIGGPGNDTMNGGAGVDWVSFMGAAQAAQVDLAVTGPQATGHGLDVILNVENLHGGAGNDTLMGNAQANVIRGGNGADRILGRQGDDLLDGNMGADILDGGMGNDTLFGGFGNDQLFGGMGNDWLYGGVGNDTLNGGAGTDWVSFMGEARAARVDLALSGAQATGHGLDVILNVENIHGGAGNDTLLGNAQGNVIRGGNGADRLLGRQGNDVLEGNQGGDFLDGGLGNDTLIGGIGNDQLMGGAGNDMFVFRRGFDQDFILDFQDNIDTIRVLDFGVANFAQARDFAIQSGSDVIFDFGDGDILTVRNTNLNVLGDDLVFV